MNYKLMSVRLRVARKLIADPHSWTKGTSAKAKKIGGQALVPCDPFSRRACAWCATGAIQRGFGHRIDEDRDYDGSMFDEAVRLVACVSGDYDEANWLQRNVGTIAAWNDSEETVHRDVLEAFDNAIAVAECYSGEAK